MMPLRFAVASLLAGCGAAAGGSARDAARDAPADGARDGATPAEAGGDGDAAAPGGLGVVIGTALLPDESDFVPLGDGDPLEIVVGKQDIAFCRLRYGVTGSSGRVVARAHIAIEGQEPFDRGPRPLPVADEPGVGPLTDVHQIVFTDFAVADVIGSVATIAATLTDDENGATGEAAVEVVLRDDDACVDAGGGLCVTPDGGADAGGGDAGADGG